MSEIEKNKMRKNLTLSKKSIEMLERLKTYSLPELSYSQIVDRAIIDYSKVRKVYKE